MKLTPEIQPTQLDIARMAPIEWPGLKSRLRARLVRITNELEYRREYDLPADDDETRLVDELDQIDELLDFLAVLNYRNPE